MSGCSSRCDSSREFSITFRYGINKEVEVTMRHLPFGRNGFCWWLSIASPRTMDADSALVQSLGNCKGCKWVIQSTSISSAQSVVSLTMQDAYFLKRASHSVFLVVISSVLFWLRKRAGLPKQRHDAIVARLFQVTFRQGLLVVLDAEL
jgi:predicted Rdx family selenoprotein